MIVRQALASSAWCSSCRIALAKAFISPSDICVRSFTPQGTTQINRNVRRPSRFFTSSRIRFSDAVEPSSHDRTSEEDNAFSTEEDGAQGEHPTDGTPSLPWYLQVEPPQSMSNPLLQRQQLPPLPPDAPPLLEPMLEHISTDLGLDDLTLFDLRNIDPPPALGANILMIIGTARSEKHLHVSADRFCRWLKVTHKLSPYADGLLGRGELKLKLRRKARRARLLSNVGSAEHGASDDGIRTGWICVNIGVIPDGKRSLKGYTEQEDYVGFEDEAEGAKVVVQMLTHEKREELDLESLWGNMLKRHERKEVRIAQGESVSQSNYLHGESALLGTHTPPRTPFLTRPRSLKSSNVSFGNLIAPHQRRLMSATTVEGSPEYLQDEEASSSGHHRLEKVVHGVSQAQGPSYRLEALLAHLSFLRALPKFYALKALGRDSSDTDSTDFLQSFYGIYPENPNVAHWTCRLKLFCCAVVIGHPGYTKPGLIDLWYEVQSHVPPSERMSLLVFETLLSPNPAKTSILGQRTLTKESIYSAFIVLDTMYFHGYKINTPRQSLRLRHAVNFAFRDGPVIRPNDPDRLKSLLDELHARLCDRPSYPSCLRVLINSCEKLPKGTHNVPFLSLDQALGNIL